MSRFRILRIDSYDPVSVGRRNRLLYTIYGIIPFLFMMAFNLGQAFGFSFQKKLLISIPALALIYFFLLKKVRSNIDNLRQIGELEITQACLRKRIGDSLASYNYELIKEVSLTKHIPATRIKESKGRYFSYILKIVFHDGTDECMVVTDRSVDHNQKISLADTIKTLKKIVPFTVIIEI
jgi:hypothetical protein